MIESISQPYQPAERRPLASRDAGTARRAAAWLIARGVSANAVSVSSMGFAGVAALCLAGTRTATDTTLRLLFLLAALLVQLRLLANLLDGMVAVGTRRASALGELYNEVPDRVADVIILVGAGFALGGSPTLGYQAALVAVITAYLRALGNSAGVRALFCGPMAKPQRMATITAACVYCACAPVNWPGSVAAAEHGAMAYALLVIVSGGLVTALRRLRRIADKLRGRRCLPPSR
jgi:phosphatidylglycerophosphate synthase